MIVGEEVITFQQHYKETKLNRKLETADRQQRKHVETMETGMTMFDLIRHTIITHQLLIQLTLKQLTIKDGESKS